MKILSYRSPLTEVRSSKIHGKGIFAKVDIRKAEVVAVKGGSILTESQLRLVNDKIEAAQMQVADGLYISPANEAEREIGMLYTNHSCDANMGLQGQIVFVAIRDIEKDEELTIDWAMLDDGDYEHECNCQLPRCRKILTGKDWMRKELQQKYQGYFSWHMQNKIDQLSLR